MEWIKKITDAELPVAEAVGSYLFNSQLVCTPDGAMRLIVAQECRENAASWRAVERIVADPANPVAAVDVFDLRQSMRNGGGPACLRLRVVCDPRTVDPRFLVDPAKLDRIEGKIGRAHV